MAQFTEVEYLYRDYGNWKFYGEFVLRGKFDWETAKPFLFEGTKFIPREVGLESLTPKEVNDDDHWLHEIVGTEFVSTTQKEPVMSSAEFLKKLQKANAIGWLELCPWV